MNNWKKMDGEIVKTGDGKEADERIETCSRTGSDELNLANLRLELFPGDVFGVSFIRTLNLRGNKLEYLPQTIDLLKNLEILNISENQLKKLPPGIGGMKKLKKLQLQKNKLVEIPPEIGQLSQLVELYLGNNRIESLCDEIVDLVRLETLDASNNLLETFPEDFSTKSMPNLRVVNFQGNPIDTNAMPWSIKCLQEMFPILMNTEERRRLVKRNLKIKQQVNERILL